MHKLDEIYVEPETIERINRRIRAANYLTVAQLYLKDNFYLRTPLKSADIKSRLLGHWGTCPGINLAYANLQAFYHDDPNFSFVLGPGHGFPALQANLFLDGKLELLPKDQNGKNQLVPLTYTGVRYLCQNFSWPDGYPSHASPLTPGVVTEGGELGYAISAAYGVALGHPERTVAVLIGDGELETATALDSLNLNHLLSGPENGRVLPILHLNGYKISAPSLYARLSKHTLNSLIRGFNYTPIWLSTKTEVFQQALELIATEKGLKPFLILKTEKGATGPTRHQDAHQIPLKNPKTDTGELKMLENWLRSYHFENFVNGDNIIIGEKQ